jgi:preprotein translocase subunit SecD
VKQTTKLAVSIGMIVVLVALTVTAFVMGIVPQQGLDLVGGVSVVLEAPHGTKADVMDRTVNNIRDRVDALGVGEALIGRLGSNDIQVEVPGLGHGTTFQAKNGKWCAKTNGGKLLGCTFDTKAAAETAIQQEGQSRLLAIIGQTARLEERQVIGQATSSDKVTACPSYLAKDPKCNDPKYVTCTLSQVDATSGPCSQASLGKQNVVFLGDVQTQQNCPSFDNCPRNKLGPVQVTGDAISKATAVYNTQPTNGTPAGWLINFDLTGPGSSLFCTVSTNLKGQQLAIVLDRNTVTAPVIQSPICGGSGQITGNFSESQAKDLALVLNQGALPVDLKRLNVETVSPTLGKQSVHQGLIAGLVGLALLMLYLAFYYRLLGVVTWFGMAIWAVFAFGFVSVLGRTISYRLSLAGIAGIIVSMGITADSYIVFYERLKDEVRNGKTLRTAVQPAFKRSWRTIVAADIVTAMGAAVLYVVSVGSVRGFALTLGFCTALDLLVVYFFKRPTVFLIARSPKLANLRGIGLRSGVAADPAPTAVPAPVAGASE